jgi:hypothetical protein
MIDHMADRAEANRRRVAIRAAVARPIWRVEGEAEVMCVGVLDGKAAVIKIAGNVDRAVPLADVTRIEVTAGAPRRDYRHRNTVRSAAPASETHAHTLVVAWLANGGVMSIVCRGEAGIHRAHVTQAVAGQVAVVG